MRVTLRGEAGGHCLFATGCLRALWRWLPGVTLWVLPLLLRTCDGSTDCARGCRGHGRVREGRRRGQVEGRQEAAVASASTVQAPIGFPLDFGGLQGHRAGPEPHHPALG